VFSDGAGAARPAFLVENKPGAGSDIATEDVSHSRPIATASLRHLRHRDHATGQRSLSFDLLSSWHRCRILPTGKRMVVNPSLP